jgi:cobalt-zinc-cadmium resistance protein CzcA
VVPVALGLIFLHVRNFQLGAAGIAGVRGIPFMIGGVLALITRIPVGTRVGGFIVDGIAVLNGLVLISYFNQLRNKGVELS